MSAILWVMISVIAIALMGLAFTIGWILASNERDHHRLVQAGIGAAFVAVALTIVVVQGKLVVSQQHTFRCNTLLINALAARNRAQVNVNSAGVHFHEHMLIWLDTESQEQHGNSDSDILSQLKQSIDELINARNAALKVEAEHPLPDCR